VLAIVFVTIGHLTDTTVAKAIGHLAIISLGLMWLYKIKLYQWTQDFQHNFFPRMEDKYKNFLAKILTGRKAWYALAGIIGMLFFSFILLGISPRKVLFFPDNIPNQVITYIEYPQGTDIAKTNKATLFVEKQVIAILEKYVDKETNKNYLAESIVSQVGVGAGNPNVDAGSASETPYKGKVTVNFSEFKYRKGVNTTEVLDEIRAKVKGIAGATVTVEKDANGPPAGYPISIQLTGID
jgi:multidrug efflux pump subunit AcrB